MNKWYVYIYLDPRKPGIYTYDDIALDYEPFYVGKGKDDRCDHHVSKINYKCTKNSYKSNKIKFLLDNGLKPIIVKLADGLNEPDSLKIEIITIRKIGRHDLDLGPLCNLTNGGDGLINPSSETRRKISEGLKGKIPWNLGKVGMYSDETRRKISEAVSKQMKGIPRTEHEKQCISRTHKGKIVSAETKRKLSESHKGSQQLK